MFHRSLSRLVWLRGFSVLTLATVWFAVVDDAAADAAAGDAVEWKVGFARVEITPEQPLRMAGYASRTEPSAGVASELFAKAMAIEDGEGKRGVLISADLIGFRAEFAEPTCERICERTGLSRDQILLNASHTHTGPTLGLDVERLGFPPEQAQATVDYTRGLQAKLVELASESLDRLEPAKLSWGVGVTTFVMNRREFTERGVILGVNPRGLADRSAPVLRIDSPEGKLRGVLFGTACHNTTLTGKDMNISGDFAGYAQRQVEMAHPGAQAMFMQGCAGDANPFPRGSEELATLHGRTLGAEVLRVLDTELQPVCGPLRITTAVTPLPLVAVGSAEELEQFASERGRWGRTIADKLREQFEAGEQPAAEYPAPLAVWQFGKDLTLVALPGEVVVDYVASIEQAVGPRRLWVAAYCNDVFGYIPSARVLDEGGYETRGLYAGGVGLFAPEVQARVVDQVRQLAEAAGRPID